MIETREQYFESIKDKNKKKDSINNSILQINKVGKSCLEIDGKVLKVKDKDGNPVAEINFNKNTIIEEIQNSLSIIDDEIKSLDNEYYAFLGINLGK